MGIQGLLPFVRKSCRPANLKDFSGSTVAIDAYSWLHKGAFSCAEKLVKGEPTDGYVYYCMKYLNLIIEAGLTPIMVFDGCNLPSKAGTEKKRRENRERTRQRGKELLCEGKVKEARECFQRCVDVTPEMAREVILACKKKSIDCIVAPYEADAQLAYLAKTGIAQLIITEDSDLILFGCNRILFKMDCNGGGLLFEKENLPKSFGAKSSKFSFEKFLYMCILSGCDYLPSLPGIGLAKAFKFFSLTANTDLTSVLPKLPSYLKMPQLTVPKEYVESFIKAYNTFLYQLVFCPREKKFVPLNPYPEDVNPDEMEYAGQYLPADVACQLAMGNINVKTMEEFDDSQSDTSSVWDDTWGSQSSQKHTKSSQKEVVSAFVFNSQKRKPSTLSNCIKAETADVGNNGGDTCTNEELFAMYRVQTPPEDDLTAKSFEELAMESFEDDLAMGSFEDDSDIINTEDDSDIINTEDETPTSSQSSYHPRELNMPFRKITRSRFFSSEDEQSSKNVKVHKEDECNVSSSIENSLLEENDFKDDCNSSNAPKVRSPVKENKENFRNIFAKRKVVTCVEESPSKKMKSSALIDTIDDESGASTSTVSSSGLASKLLTSTKSEFVTPASPKSFFNSRKKPKRYRTTKLSSFDWKNLSDSKAQLNSSLGSDSNSCDEILEIKRELEEVITGIPPLVRPGDASPFFSTPVTPSVYVETPEELEELFLQAAESSLEHIDSTVKKELIEPEDSLFPTPASSHESVNSPTSVEVKEELVDEDSSDIQVLYSSTEKKSIGSATGSKVLKPIDNKSKTGKCRTIGLSKNKKSNSKVSMKESLLNFNFIRLPKKEMAGT